MPVGKSSKDIFTKSPKKKKTVTLEVQHGTAGPGGEFIPDPQAPPKKHTERYSKVTVVLFDRQVAYLDRLCADVKVATGDTLKRAEIIRGLIDGLEAAKIPPESLTSEEAVRELATARLKGK